MKLNKIVLNGEKTEMVNHVKKGKVKIKINFVKNKRLELKFRLIYSKVDD